MANLNKVMLIGRLGKDPEVRMFANGGKVCNWSFCVNNKKKNQSTGQWEDVPCWLDCSAFNRGEHGKTADLCEQYLRKGHQCFIEGHLVMDEWEDKNGGGKRQKIKIVVDSVQFLEPKKDGGQSGGQSSQRQQHEPRQQQNYDNDLPPPPQSSDEEIPF